VSRTAGDELAFKSATALEEAGAHVEEVSLGLRRPWAASYEIPALRRPG
jgi:hypothetical protein